MSLLLHSTRTAAASTAATIRLPLFLSQFAFRTIIRQGVSNLTRSFPLHSSTNVVHYSSVSRSLHCSAAAMPPYDSASVIRGSAAPLSTTSTAVKANPQPISVESKFISASISSATPLTRLLHSSPAPLFKYSPPSPIVSRLSAHSSATLFAKVFKSRFNSSARSFSSQSDSSNSLPSLDTASAAQFQAELIRQLDSYDVNAEAVAQLVLQSTKVQTTLVDRSTEQRFQLQQLIQLQADDRIRTDALSKSVTDALATQTQLLLKLEQQMNDQAARAATNHLTEQVRALTQQMQLLQSRPPTQTASGPAATPVTVTVEAAQPVKQRSIIRMLFKLLFYLCLLWLFVMSLPWLLAGFGIAWCWNSTQPKNNSWWPF